MDNIKTYFIQSGGGPIKIGISMYVQSRLKDLQTANPFKLRLLGYIKGNKEMEIQTNFNDLRISGEWFKGAKKLLDWIRENTITVNHPSKKDLWSEIEIDESDVNNYGDIVIDYEDISDEMFGKWCPNSACKLFDYIIKAMEQDNSRRENILRAAAEECDCDWHTWERVVYSLSDCDIIKKVGVNSEEKTIYLGLKYINSGKKREQAYRELPALALDLDSIYWHLHGWLADEWIPPQKIDFFWLNIYGVNFLRDLHGN